MSSLPPEPAFPMFLRRLVIGVKWGGVLGVVYVLSIGPALQLNRRGFIPPELLEWAYLPVSCLCDVPGGQWLLDRYVSLWVSPNP